MMIGIDLGGTKTEVIALDDQGVEHFRHRVPTPKTITSPPYKLSLNWCCWQKTVWAGKEQWAWVFRVPFPAIPAR